MTREEKKAYMLTWRANNKSRIAASRKAYHAANPDKVKQWDRNKYAKHGDKIRARVNSYRNNNPELIKDRKAKYFRDNKEAILPKNKARYEANKDKILPVMRAYYLRNKESYSKKAKENYLANPAYYKEKARNWKYINPERYRLTRAKSSTMWRNRLFSAPGWFTQDQVKVRFDYYDWLCRYCGVQLTAETVTLEHQIPLSRGGSNWPSNIVPACDSCNSSKRDQMPWEFRPLMFSKLHRSRNTTRNLFDERREGAHAVNTTAIESASV